MVGQLTLSDVLRNELIPLVVSHAHNHQTPALGLLLLFLGFIDLLLANDGLDSLYDLIIRGNSEVGAVGLGTV